MAYDKTVWQDRIVDQASGTVLQEGTPINANNLNKIEDQIESLSNESKQTTSFASSVFTLPEATIEGQVNVGIKGQTWVNGVKNGSFENDFTDWEGTGTISNSFSRTGSKSVDLTSSGSPIVARQDIKYQQGHKIYVKAFLNLTSYTEGNTRLSVFDYGTFDNQIFQNIDTSKLNQWQSVSVIKEIIDNIGLRVYLETANIPTLTVFADDVMAYDLTAIFGAGNEPTKEECDQIFHYVDNVKSTVLAQRLLSHGKNHLPPFYKWIDNSGVFTILSDYEAQSNPTASLQYLEIWIRCKPNTTYTLKPEVNGDTIEIKSFDIDKSNSLGSAYTTTTSSASITTTSNAYYLRIRIYTSNSSGTYTWGNIQLEEGSSATIFEEYQESTSYIYAEDENGDILEAHSLPNGVKDEVSDGKLYKRNKKYLLQSGDITSLVTSGTNVDYVVINKPTDYTMYSKTPSSDSDDNLYSYIFENYQTANFNSDTFDNTTNINKISNRAGMGYFWLVIEKGTYADLAAAQADLVGLPLTYQLATPITYEIPNLRDLYFFDGETTIIVEPAIEFEAIADSSGQITIPDANLPIAFVESVKEKIIDGNSISYIDADYTEVDTTTLGSLTEGKKYKIVYHYNQELTTIPELEITYGMNTAETISSLVDVQRKLEDELGSVWITLLPLADKELAMYGIATIATDMSADANDDELKTKINEIINVWKG